MLMARLHYEQVPLAVVLKLVKENDESVEGANGRIGKKKQGKDNSSGTKVRNRKGGQS